MSATALRPRRRAAGHARKPGKPLPQRIGRRLPSRGRVLAILAFACLLGGLVTVVNGPWLRVERIAHAGEQFTPASALDEILAPYRGASLLSLDGAALAGRLEQLPAVASATVESALPGDLRVSIVEKAPAFVWTTAAVQLVGAADGSIIAQLAKDTELPQELATLPVVDDRRAASRLITVGDVIPAGELDMARRILDLDPALLGSHASTLGVRIDREFGFIVIPDTGGWTAALGFYELDPGEDTSGAAARLEAQVAAIRTLFATVPGGSVSWVDARNPGKVYWKP